MLPRKSSKGAMCEGFALGSSSGLLKGCNACATRTVFLDIPRGRLFSGRRSGFSLSRRQCQHSCGSPSPGGGGTVHDDTSPPIQTPGADRHTRVLDARPGTAFAPHIMLTSGVLLAWIQFGIRLKSKYLRNRCDLDQAVGGWVSLTRSLSKKRRLRNYPDKEKEVLIIGKTCCERLS